jgi:formate dehydrogenase subunit gamma
MKPGRPSPAASEPHAPEHEALVAEVLRAQGTDPAALLPIFHALQDRLGFVPLGTLPLIAKALNVSRADVYGTLTFYHDFRTSPPGRHVVKLCRAEACQAVGCERLAEEASAAWQVRFGGTSPDGQISLEPVYCLGNCALGPSALVDGRLLGRTTLERLRACLGTGEVPA